MEQIGKAGQIKQAEQCGRKILVVDDHREILKMVETILKESGYTQIFLAACAAQAMKCFLSEKPDLIILDIMLPDEDGFSLFQRIREKADVPILFLSAKDEDEDRLFGLGLGADDYITKPFLPEELALRIGVILKRAYSIPEEQREKERHFFLGEREILPERAVVKYRDQENTLTAKELMLLEKLYQNRGRIVTFDTLCNAVWGDSYYGYENTLMVHIRHLREKIEEDPSHPRWILTARGLGYRLVKE
ncbi:MAG: response regulator transcription factor [Ruminococcus sp.]|nr:response regulator transcription factor [Ruminococcus sp.]